MSPFVMSILAALAGVSGGLSASRLPPSGKAALALTPLPIVGVLLSMQFC